MGKQHNKIEKRKRRAAYLKRKRTPARTARTVKAWARTRPRRPAAKPRALTTDTTRRRGANIFPNEWKSFSQGSVQTIHSALSTAKRRALHDWFHWAFLLVRLSFESGHRSI